MADWVEPLHASSSVEYVDESSVSRARSGVVRMRRLQSNSARVFHLPLRGLTATRRDAVMTLYGNKRALTLTLNWTPTNESAIVCVFGPQPIVWTQEANRWSAEVQLYEVTPP